MKSTAALAILALALPGCRMIPPADPARVPPAQTQPIPGPAPAPAYSPAPNYTPPPEAPAPSEDPLIYAALGQTVSVSGPRVTPLQVLEDSRCPMNARCVWAGQVRLRVRIESGTGGELELTSGKPARVADGTLELVQIRPDKVAGGDNGGTIAPNAYRFGFRFMGGY
ncbi:hypothetical protein [Novosphingobium kaempferiae]|uniref:hypothetical protein n=1 Tax=Novosphingobium kaempferiae TaxID=2896849 RepID=UPI001E5091E0|nr:hypothetical protein [Novosphingobium kaempferiae]